jgi:NADH:ubiquinone oxidoreductase subunit E
MLIKICTGPACHKNFSQYTLERAEREAAKNPKLQIETCGCQGNCERGPTVVTEKNGKKNVHNRVNGIELKRIIDKN